MVIISHDRAFLDQLVQIFIETVMAVLRTYERTNSEYVMAKPARLEAKLAEWEKQQKGN